jgi:putative ABC transport system permease protein
VVKGVLTTKLRRDLRRSRAQFIAVAVTIFLGITLYGGSFDAYRSLEASYERVFEDLSFADYWVAGGDGEAIASAAAALPGVAAVETRTRADLALRPRPDHSLFGRVVGVPASRRPAVNDLLVLDGGYLDPSDPDTVLVERHMADHFDLRPGDEVGISAPDGWRSFTVAGVVSSAEYLWPSPSRQELIASMDDFGVVFVAEEVVGELAGPAAAGEVVVRYGDGAARSDLDSAMAGLVERWGATDGYPRAEQPANSALQADVKGFGELSFMFPLLFLTAAGLGTWVMLTRMVMSQMSVIGTLMASGMRRRTMFGHYLSYGVVVGLAGALPGVVAGVLLAWGIAGLYTGAISVPITVLRIDATTPLVGLVFGLVTGIAAAAFPAWRAVRRSPAEAMRGAHPSGTAKPTILERLVPPLRRLPASLAMVMRGISRNARRTATTMLGVVLSLVLILVSWGMIDTVEALMARQFDEIEQSDARVVLDRPAAGDVLDTLGAVPGVRAVEPTLQVQVAVQANGERYGTTLEAYLPGTTMHRFLSEGGEIPLPAEGVLLGEDMSGLLGVAVGDEVTVRVPALDAVVPLRVAGFVDEPLGTYAYASVPGLLGSLQLDGAAAAGEAPPVVFGAAVRFDPGAEPGVMRSRLQEADGVVAVSGTRAFEETLRSFMGLFYAFVGVMLLFGGLLAFGIIFNTMSVNLAERTVEVATLKASGMTDRRLAGLVSLENLLVTLLGILPGLAIGYLTAAEFMAAYDNDQFSFMLQMRPRTMVVSAAVIVGVTLLSQWPGLRAIRRLDVASVVRERAV